MGMVAGDKDGPDETPGEDSGVLELDARIEADGWQVILPDRSGRDVGDGKRDKDAAACLFCC